MNTLLKINIISAFAIASIGLNGFSTVSAKEICFTQYGGGEKCIDVEEKANIDLDKKVSESDGDFKNHIKSSEHKFSAGDYIYFELSVKNTGDVKLKSVTVNDTLPSFVSYDKTLEGNKPEIDGKNLKFELNSLDAGESEKVVFRAKIVDDEDLPKDDKVCLTNIAETKGVRVDDKNSKEKDSDYSNFCVNLPEIKGAESPTQLPKAGGENMLALVGVVSTIAGVITSRKLNRKF